MSRPTFVLAFAVAVAGIVWWCAPGDPAPAAMRTADSPAAAPAAPESATLVAAPSEAARQSGRDGAWWVDVLTAEDPGPETAAADDPRAVVLRGRLTVRQQPWLHPAGVEVRVTRSWLDSVVPVETSPESRVPQREDPRAITDEQGCFAFRLVPPATELFFLIGHRTTWQDFQRVPRVPRAGEEVDLGDVFVDQRGSIVGRIAGGTSGTVRAVDDPLLDGNASLAEHLAGRIEGIETFRVPGSLQDGAVPNWVVQRDRYLPFPQASVDRGGNFRIDGVRPGTQCVFVTTPFATGRRAGILVAPGRATDVGTIELRENEPVSLVFVDQHRAPWIGANVAFVSGELGAGNVALRTDGTGRIDTVLPVARDDMRMLFGAPGGGPWLPVPWDRESGAVVVPRPPGLVVVLSDEAGAMVVGARVRAYVRRHLFRPVDRELPAAMQPREEASGRFVGVLPCPLVLVASAPGFAPALADVREGGSVVVKMLRMFTMTVRVRDLHDRPIEGALVRAQVHDNPELKFPGAAWAALADSRVVLGLTDERGEVAVPAWPTSFSFQASHRDYAPSASAKVMASPGQRHDVLLRGAAYVVGTLTLETRPAPRGLRVRARHKPPDGHDLATRGWLDERLAVTGENGVFAFRQLVAGNWELTPELPALPAVSGARPALAFAPTQVHLEDGQEKHVAIVMQPEHTAAVQIAGVVTQNGAPVADVLVRLRELPPAAPGPPKTAAKPAPTLPADVRRKLRRHLRDVPEPPPAPVAWLARCETTTFGEFAFRELRQGTEYELRVDAPVNGRMQFLGRRVVRAGSGTVPERCEITIPAATLQIACSRQTSAFANRMVRLRQRLEDGTDAACFELLLDANGQAFVEHLPLGRWTIEPVHGGRCVPEEFELRPGQVLSLQCSVVGA